MFGFVILFNVFCPSAVILVASSSLRSWNEFLFLSLVVNAFALGMYDTGELLT